MITWLQGTIPEHKTRQHTAGGGDSTCHADDTIIAPHHMVVPDIVSTSVVLQEAGKGKGKRARTETKHAYFVFFGYVL